MSKLTFLSLLCIFHFQVVASSDFHVETLNGHWNCEQQFNLTDEVLFEVELTAFVSLEDNQGTTKGTITTSFINDPSKRSVLKVSSIEEIYIHGNDATFYPTEIQAEVLENGLGQLSDDFVAGFKSNRAPSKARFTILGKNEVHFKYYDTGNIGVCLRK